MLHMISPKSLSRKDLYMSQRDFKNNSRINKPCQV